MLSRSDNARNRYQKIVCPIHRTWIFLKLAVAFLYFFLVSDESPVYSIILFLYIGESLSIVAPIFFIDALIQVLISSLVDSSDLDLISYYIDKLKFCDDTRHTVAKPLYDFACKFLYQEAKSLPEKKLHFFNHFNPDKDAI